MSAPELLEQIRRLPASEQRELAEMILSGCEDSDDELSPEQIAELDRRAGEALNHPRRGRPAEEVFAEIEGRLRSGK